MSDNHHRILCITLKRGKNTYAGQQEIINNHGMCHQPKQTSPIPEKPPRPDESQLIQYK